MFIRLTITQPHPDSLQPQGLFAATYALMDADELSDREIELFDALLDWFGEHLPIPRSRAITERAIFWLKPDERECAQRMWDLAGLLKVHGRLVQLHKTHHPGYILFEDAYQVAAEPVVQQPRRVRRDRRLNSVKAWRRFIRRSRSADLAARGWWR